MHCPHHYQHPPSVIEPRSPGLQVQSLGQEDYLEKEMATQSNIAWKILEDCSPWSHERVRDDVATK